ncbi:hypothetical protein [Macrococcus armenti]|uniref:LPXTG cell wall anchor domain-containing protein n=1 Tax=Macrococcus armenti TaxID=2875764 RepID=A0ABY3ZTS4_9STAP|nr:hypothetical protein [Macrococcus armenti]UOB20233.1 hypothetical protein MRZ06_09560 [Macrococcus armenti]
MMRGISLIIMGLMWLIIGIMQWTPEDNTFTILYGAIGVAFLIFGIRSVKKGNRV